MSESWTSAGEKGTRESRPAKWNVQPDVPSTRPAFHAPASTSKSAIPPHDPDASIVPPPAVPMEPEKIVDPALTAEFENLVTLLTNALSAIAKTDDNLDKRIADQALDLGLTVAGELAAGAVEVEPGRVSTLIQESLALMEEESVIHVRLHPDIFTILDEASLLEELKVNPRIQIRMDAAVGQHGCVVESPHKRVDARIEARLKQIRHLLTLEEEEQS